MGGNTLYCADAHCYLYPLLWLTSQDSCFSLETVMHVYIFGIPIIFFNIGDHTLFTHIPIA